jgi:protein-L-isoaspartate(D-aspartate) O-methyltransferase
VLNAELNSEGARKNNPMDAGHNHDWAAQRRAMVEEQIRKRGISSPRLLEALARVPRHLFVPEELALHAYEDRALGIGEQQTISQPYMVAAMTEYLELQGTERVLEVGAGSGYQAAVLAELASEVITVEKNVSLAESARARLASLGYLNIRVEIGDGTMGWAAAAPFEGILVAAAAPAVPPPLTAQLAEGGRLIIPVGESDKQMLMRIRKRDGEIMQEKLFACQFVPLLGRYGWPDAAE